MAPVPIPMLADGRQPTICPGVIARCPSARTPSYSGPDGPWTTIHAGARCLTFSLREMVRGLMPAEISHNRRRTMTQWLKARDTEGAVAKIAAPDVLSGTRLGPRMKAKR